MGVAQNYTNRDITYNSDKLVALSGLAREFVQVASGRYLAGLWEQRLKHVMLWRRDYYDHLNSFKERHAKKHKLSSRKAPTN